MVNYVKIKGIKEDVFPVSLGTVQYGTALADIDAHKQMDTFIELGGNLIDTAHVYGDWVSGVTGRSEKVIGKWLAKTKNRDKVLISTKGAHPPLDNIHQSRLQPEDMEKDLSESLDNLQTDRIDLYFLHRDDPSVPVRHILEWLEQQIHAGRIRAYGCSNWSLNRLTEAQQVAKNHQLSGFACNQILDSLADFDTSILEPSLMYHMDPAYREAHRITQLPVMAYMAAAKGFFEKSAAGLPINDQMKKMYDCPSNQALLLKIRDTLEQGFSVTDLVCQFILKQPYPAIAIAAFSKLEQMQAWMQAADAEVPDKLIQELTGMKTV